jgi:prefoldin subunit 5
MGFHVEMTFNEALDFVEKRIRFLRNNKLAEKEKKIDEISEHISSATSLLQQLQEEMKNEIEH